MKLRTGFRIGQNSVPDSGPDSGPEVVSFVGGGGKTTTLFRLAREIAADGGRVVLTTTTHMARTQTQDAPAVVTVEETAAGARLPLDEISQALDVHGQCLVVGPIVSPATEDSSDLSLSKCTGITPAQVDWLAQFVAQLSLTAILVEADGSRTRPIKAPADHEPAVPRSTTLLVPVVGMDAVGRRIAEPFVHRPERLAALLGLQDSDGSVRLTPAMVAGLLMHPSGGAKHRPPGARLIPLLNKAETPTRLVLARLVAGMLARQRVPALIGATGMEEQSPIRERWGPGAVVVLAGGRSERMGTAKQLLVVDGEPMVVRAARVALDSGAHQVVVVTGAYAGEVADALAPLQTLAGERLRRVHNAAWESGQATSMQAGLRWLDSNPDSVVEMALFMPVDQPFLRPALLRRMTDAWRRGARLVAPLVDGKPRGAPGLFDRSLWPELLAVEGDVGGRALFKRYAGQTVTIPVAADQLRDMDTPADLSV